MSIELKSGADATIATADPLWKALRSSPRPLDLTGGGSFRVALRSGTLPAALAANGLLFHFRFGNHANFKAVLHRVRVQVHANLLFTTAFHDMSLRGYVTRGYTVNDSTGAGATAATLSGNNAKKRTADATSLINTDGGIRIAGTAVLSGGTGTDDTDPFLHSIIGRPNNLNPAVATEFLEPVPLITLDYEPGIGDGVMPHVFAANEGFRIRNGPTVWPAAGTGILVVTVDWSEVPNAALA